MKRLLKILTAAVAVILLFTACQQFLEDPEDFLSYWASETFVKNHSIDSAHRPDKAGVPCVGSSASVDITLSVHNPKGFSFVMPTFSAPAGIVEFKELSSPPEVGTDYELERTSSTRLKLTYKPSLLQKYEQGSGSLNPTITLKAKDGRVFKQTYTFGIKSNTPPPKPEKIVIAKTKGADSRYVLCLKFDLGEMEKMVTTSSSSTVPVHKDIEKITINGFSYDLLYKDVTSGFQKPAETTKIGSFIESGEVEKLDSSSLDVPSGKWVLYFKTEVAVESVHGLTAYEITLIDNKGVVSDIKPTGLPNKFKVTFDSQGGSIVPAQYIENNGKVTRPTDPTKAGNTLDGWYKNPAGIPGQEWDFANDTVTQDITLYANWTPVTNAQYVVKHYKEALDGTYPLEPPHADTEHKSGRPGTNAAYTPNAYEGFTYESNLTNINGIQQTSGNIAADGSTVVKLYYKRKIISVKFNPNGGNIGGNTGTVTKTGKYGAPLTAPTATKSGYTFSGWNLTPPAPALPSTFPAVNAEYTAQWTPNTYYVRFNGNGNTDGSMSDQTFTYGQSQQLSANGFIKTGHTFDGWATSAGGSKVYDNQQSVSNLTNVQNGTVNLYAVWKIKTYTVTFSVAAGEGKLQGTYGTQNQTAQNGSGTKTLNSVPHGSSVSFTATADEGWEVEGWTVSSGSFATGGGSGAANATATLTVDGPKTVTVKFKPGVFDLAGGPDAWKRLKKEVEKTEGAHTITISGEITATNGPGNNGKISIRRELIIKSSGSSASLNANNLSGIFDVNNKLTLENITLKNGAEPGNRTGAGAYVNSTLIMKGSSAITNCSAHKGGGVYVNNGTLIMQDSSTISSCTATDKGSGVYVAGTFEMKGNARVNTNNDVYLESGKSITVTGSLSHHPAARITPNSYTNGRVLATGAAEKANFKVTPQDGNKYWRFKKQGGEVKFVPAKLKVTFNKIKCVEVKDASSEAEYYWTMKVGKYVIAERPSNSVWDAKKGHIYEFIENGEYNKYFNWDFSYFPISEIPDINTTPKNYIPVYINIMEYDKSDPDDHIGTTKAHLTYDYDNDQWKWEYDGSQSHGNQESNPHITIGDGGEEIFTEEYRTNDGDTDVTITISWKE